MEMKCFDRKNFLARPVSFEASLGLSGDLPTNGRLHKALSGGGPLMNLVFYCGHSPYVKVKTVFP